jgi:hypothetical protein
MPRKKAQTKHAARSTASRPVSAFEKGWESLRSPSSPRPTVSGRWLLTAASLALLAAAVCAWGALCLLFWQGSWQLLYHPTSAVARTPASVGLIFDQVGFATTEAGEPQLKGWWIPAGPDARFSRYTALYLHGQTGNLGEAVDALAALHGAGVNILAFDYRGYGQSQFTRPSEIHWREDAEGALKYLTGTRHEAADTILLDGKDLGANLALEVGAEHGELAGVVLESPLDAPVDAIFRDPRAHLVPAHLLVRDRFDAKAAAAALRIPSLWFLQAAVQGPGGTSGNREAFQKVNAPKMLVWLTPSPDAKKDYGNALARWLGDLPKKDGVLQAR